MLLADAEGHAAGGEDAQAAGGCDQLGDERKRTGKVLEVVEHQQAGLVERRAHVLEERPPRRLLDTESLGHGREHELRVGERREIDLDRTADLGGSGPREARLTDPADARERHQSHVASAKERSHGRELELAADETGAVGLRRWDGRPEVRIVFEDPALERAQLG